MSDASVNPSSVCQRDTRSTPKREKAGKTVSVKRGHEICDGFLLTKAFEFFMLQILNFCCSSPDLLLISAQPHSRAYGWAWECQCHLFSRSPCLTSLPPCHMLSVSLCLGFVYHWHSFESLTVSLLFIYSVRCHCLN